MYGERCKGRKKHVIIQSRYNNDDRYEVKKIDIAFGKELKT